MNPKPPPLADPHSTAPVPSTTEPNIWTTTIVPIALWLLGAPFMLFGSMIVIAIPGASEDYNLSRSTQIKDFAFGLALAVTGVVLCYFGSRFWRRSRRSPS